jgi:hypothetical protein
MFGPNALAIPLGAAAVHLGGVPPHLMAAAVCLVAATIAFGAPRNPSGRKSAPRPSVSVASRRT